MFWFKGFTGAWETRPQRPLTSKQDSYDFLIRTEFLGEPDFKFLYLLCADNSD